MLNNDLDSVLTDDLEKVQQKREEARMAVHEIIDEQDIEIKNQVVAVDFGVMCRSCYRRYSIIELYDRGGCECKVDVHTVTER